MNIKSLIDLIHSVAPSEFQEPYDNSGLITGHPDTEIRGVLICLDAIEAVVDEAIQLGCNVIVAHHPILFRPIKRLNGFDYIERTIIKAIRHDIAIFAVHTNLDNVFYSGVNGKIAERLSLSDVEILLPKPNILYKNKEVGAGMIGRLSQAMPVLEFMNWMKVKMDISHIRHTDLCRSQIEVVALCGGAGSFLISEAKRKGADIFVTADLKYHEFFDADGQMILVDIGHYESEKYTIELLYTLITNNFSTFAAHCTKTVTNPVKYL